MVDNISENPQFDTLDLAVMCHNIYGLYGLSKAEVRD